MRAALPVDMQGNLFEIFAAVVGLCVGSFTNVAAHRLSIGQSIVSPPSYCPNCETRLRWRDMIPVISWMFLRGQCRYCKVSIHRRYPIVETIGAILFVLIARVTGAAIAVVPLWCLAFVLLCVAVVDWETMEIPDVLLALGAVAGLAWVGLPLSGLSWPDALFGVAAGALPLFLLDRLVWMTAKKPAFGFGDVKLMAMAGLFIGWQGMWAAYFIAFVSGGLFGAVLLLTGRAKRGSYLAFGPFLCLGILVALLF